MEPWYCWLLFFETKQGHLFLSGGAFTATSRRVVKPYLLLSPSTYLPANETCNHDHQKFTPSFKLRGLTLFFFVYFKCISMIFLIQSVDNFKRVCWQSVDPPQRQRNRRYSSTDGATYQICRSCLEISEGSTGLKRNRQINTIQRRPLHLNTWNRQRLYRTDFALFWLDFRFIVEFDEKSVIRGEERYEIVSFATRIHDSTIKWHHSHSYRLHRYKASLELPKE